MRFGGSQIPTRLRVARTIVYCQAVIMVLIAILALEVVVIGGTQTGVTLTGVVHRQVLTGSGISTFAFALVVIGIVLVVVEQQVRARGPGARPLIAAAEVALAVYLIGFMTSSVETWVFGPAAGVAILVLHYWPELHGYFYASDQPAPATALPAPPAPAALPDPPGPRVSAGPPSGAVEPNSDANARPNL
jgi:hypothetical protein